MPAGYSRPVAMITEGVNAHDAVSNPTPPVIKGVRHLKQITGDVEWADGVTAGEIVIDLIPRMDFPDDADGTIIFESNVADDGLTPPVSLHYTYPGNANYIRHRITVDVEGGADPYVTSTLDGLTDGVVVSL